jgi:Recombination endonuclease VII
VARNHANLLKWKRENYKKNREKILAYQRNYFKAYGPKYRKKNRVKLRKKDQKYKKLNREKILKQRKLRRKKDHLRHRKDKKYDLKKRFWTLEEFKEALRLQRGRCWICGVKLVLGRRCAKTACADHDHKKKRRRGILCGRCNKLEGFLRKLPIAPQPWLERLLLYLKTFS